MPDLLTHAFLAYALFTALRWRYDWLTPRYVTVGMVGAFIPDISKLELLVDSTAVASLLNQPFSWFGVHTLGGGLVCTLIGVVFVEPSERRRVFALLSVGVLTHLVSDAMLRKASGRSYDLFWPITRYHPPSPGLYLSSDIWPSLLAGAVAAGVWLVTRTLEPTG